MKKTPVLDMIKQVKKVKTSTNKALKNKALFIFRRDLRAFDNTALLECQKNFSVCPIFIFTPEQIDKNDYKSHNSIQFMVKSLEDLKESIGGLGGHLHTYFGDNIEVITELVKANDIKAVYFNLDYSPYALKRDKKIEKMCKELSIDCFSFHDILITDGFDDIKSKEGKPYYVFNHFVNQAKKMSVRKPQYTVVQSWGKLEKNDFLVDDFKSFLLKNKYYTENPSILVQGGRKEALDMLEKNIDRWGNYAQTRNQPENTKGTTKLSAHNKFGTASIRELYYHFAGTYGDDCDLNKELLWRDFFYYLAHWFPETLEGKPIPSKVKYDNIKWEYNEDNLNRWKSGTTGFPIVDAAMRQLVQTGYMHNRSRMIVAIFLTKDLLLDWKEGEKFFAQHLTDIDWCQNTGNWHWCDGTGADGSPWLRIFNPWTQQEKYDPDCKYIFKYVPELKDVPVRSIHKWYKDHSSFKDIDYPKPMVDHTERALICKEAYGEVKKAKK